MGKVAAMEEMQLIYQASRNYLSGTGSWDDFEPAEFMDSCRSSCQRAPIGGVFLE
jgi:hypothetical protein